MRVLSLITLGLTAIIGISFALLNAHSVQVYYYVGNREVPLSLLLVVIFTVGILIGLGFLLPTVWRLRYELRRLRRKSGY